MFMKFGDISSALKKGKERWGEEPDEIIKEALEAGFEGDYEDALELLDKGTYLFSSKLDDVKTKTDLWTMKSTALSQLKRYEEALDAIDKAIKIDGKDAYLWIVKADAFHDLEDYKGSLDAVKKSSKFSQKQIKNELNYYEAHMLGHLEKNREALELYNKFLEKDPDYSDALLEKAGVLLELEKPKEALKVCEKGLEMFPDDQDLLAQRGSVLLDLNKNKEALSDFEKAIQLDATDDESWYNKACALSLLNKEEEALDALTVATSLDSENVTAMKDDKDLDNIRNTKRFNRLLAQEI